MAFETLFLLIDRGRHILYPSISHEHTHILPYLLPLLAHLPDLPDLVEHHVGNHHLHATSDDVQLASKGLERHERERKVEYIGRELKRSSCFYIADSEDSTFIFVNNRVL